MFSPKQFRELARWDINNRVHQALLQENTLYQSSSRVHHTLLSRFWRVNTQRTVQISASRPPSGENSTRKPIHHVLTGRTAVGTDSPARRCESTDRARKLQIPACGRWHRRWLIAGGQRRDRPVSAVASQGRRPLARGCVPRPFVAERAWHPTRRCKDGATADKTVGGARLLVSEISVVLFVREKPHQP